MRGLTDDRRIHSSKKFVGRQHELNLMRAWLDDADAPLQIFAITGMGGIGKSSLMAEMMRTAKERKVLGIWLDARSCTQTPAGFLEYLSAGINLETLNMDSAYSLQLLMRANPENRVLLCIDNFENLALLEGWLLEAFLPKLPLAGMAVILTSRPELSLTWKTNTFFHHCIIDMPLSYLSNEEIESYIQSAVPCHQEMAGEMARASDGHPLALALAVETVIKRKGRSDPEKMVLSQTISAHIMKELTSPELQPMLDVLIVLQYANQEVLSLMLDKPISIQLYQRLQGISFIQTGPQGLILHDLARFHLLKDFRLREPSRLNKMRAKAANILNQQLQAGDKSKFRMIALQMLWLCKDIFPLHRLYVDLTIDYFSTPLEPMNPEDLPVLHDLLNSWCEYSVESRKNDKYHEFLDKLASSFPEYIVVLRGKDKQPIGMFICVLLYKETSQLLTEYFPVEMKECCTTEELLCERNDADTFYAVLVAATDQLPGYTREELVGHLVLDRLSILGEGLRALLVATNPDLKEFLRKIGFHIRPISTRECDTDNDRADVLELDLRGNNFGNWIMSFFKEKTSQIELAPSANLTEKEVRKLLSSLNSPAKLQDFIGYFTGEISGLKLQKHLLSLMTSENSPLAEQDRALLYTAYYTHANNRIAAMDACNMSRATFYRYLNKALLNFTEMLKSDK